MFTRGHTNLFLRCTRIHETSNADWWDAMVT